MYRLNNFKRKEGKKYNNSKSEWNGRLYDSKKEMQRAMFLYDAQNKGIITDLEEQVKYELIPAVREKCIKHLKTKDKVEERTLQLAITYKADFRYKKDGVEVVEDVKASPSLRAIDKVYIVKKKLMLYVYGIQIREVYKPTEPI